MQKKGTFEGLGGEKSVANLAASCNVFLADHQSELSHHCSTIVVHFDSE